ncbi:MAG: hypothetical protein H7343_23350 [Undibacterium sp.]|nr:hypothetical protein [Opitutaceae bacterium]
MKSDQQKSVSLEDLLRLKRAERPPAEFWSQFERELRAKQLSALVVRRPWWRTLPSRGLVSFSRYHLPIGATAVLALTFLSVREYQTVAPERGVVLGLSNIPAASVATGDVSIPASSDVAETQAMAPMSSGGFSAPAEKAVAGNERSSSDASGVDRVSAMSALIGGSAESERAASPSARSIAENFAAAQSADNTFGTNRSLLINASRGFESRVLPARTPVVEPLAQMTPPSDVRRARYLGTALPVVASARQITPRSSERLASRIADERLYESLGSRLGVGGDRIMVKF